MTEVSLFENSTKICWKQSSKSRIFLSLPKAKSWKVYMPFFPFKTPFFTRFCLIWTKVMAGIKQMPKKWKNLHLFGHKHRRKYLSHKCKNITLTVHISQPGHWRMSDKIWKINAYFYSKKITFHLNFLSYFILLVFTYQLFQQCMFYSHMIDQTWSIHHSFESRGREHQYCYPIPHHLKHSSIRRISLLATNTFSCDGP